MLGRGTVLARMAVMRSGRPCLAVEADQSRLLALLAAVYGRQVDPSVVKPITRASLQWQRGEKANAHIELAFARFPRLQSEEDAFRLFLADDLLAQGMTPDHLVQKLGFDLVLLKYDSNQPRVPSGNGRESGRWTSDSHGSGGWSPDNNVRSGGENNAFLGPVAGALERLGAQSFLAEAGPSLIRALAAFAARFSAPVAVLGALFIPMPNSGGVTEGTLPDAPE